MGLFEEQQSNGVHNYRYPYGRGDLRFLTLNS